VYPTSQAGDLASAEAVIDQDLASELLAEHVGADLFLLATDVDGVYLRWGTPEQRRLRHVTPGELASYQFAAGSMGPKAEAAARFALRTGRRAAIGSPADILQIVAGQAGTEVVTPAERGSLRPAAGGAAVIAGMHAGQATRRTTWSSPGGAPPRPAETG
jgi:carbamate kinase